MFLAQPVKTLYMLAQKAEEDFMQHKRKKEQVMEKTWERSSHVNTSLIGNIKHIGRYKGTVISGKGAVIAADSSSKFSQPPFTSEITNTVSYPQFERNGSLWYLLFTWDTKLPMLLARRSLIHVKG